MEKKTQTPQLPQNAVITGALISMTDFIEKVRNIMNEKAPLKENKALEYFDLLFNYSDFLKTKLELNMFIPCDEDGNVLEYPIDIYYRPDFGCQKYPQECYEHDLKNYIDAESKVLFKGFYVKMYDNPEDDILGVIRDDNFQFKGIWYKGEKGFRLNDISAKERIESLRNCNQLTDVAIKRIFG